MALNTVYLVPDKVKIDTVLISVTDKASLELLVKGLFELNPSLGIYSTGGTLKELIRLFPDRQSQIRAIESLTGNPEIQGGLVKTLDYKIYLGLLTEPFNPDHRASLKEYGVPLIDLVVVNLYPFESVVHNDPKDMELARANIDIGGPTMIRAAAKNFHRVLTLIEPNQYTFTLEVLRQHDGCSTLSQRFSAARTAFARIAAYDRAIADYLEQCSEASLDVYRFREGGLG